jgi:hypothetical protein
LAQEFGAFICAHQSVLAGTDYLAVVYTYSSRRVPNKRVVFGFLISLAVEMASRIVSSATVKAVKGRRPIQARAALVLVCYCNK